MPKHELAFIVYEGSQETARVSWGDAERMVIGRQRGVDLRVKEPTMSSRHAELIAEGDGIHIRDLGSLNGTHVNGQRITDALIKPGDRVQIGRATILVTRAGDNHGSGESTVGTATPVATSIRELVTDPHHTLKVSLDDLRHGHDPAALEEDARILMLRDLFEALESLHDPEAIFAQLREVCRQAFRDSRVFILRSNEEGEWRDDSLEERPSFTFVGEAARTQSAILSTSMPRDERFAAAESVRISGIQTAIAAPTSCDGETAAVIYVDRLGLPAFTKRDLHLLGIAANHVSAVLENAARFNELERTQAELETLNRELERRVEERTAEVRRQADEIARLAEVKDELMGIAAHDIRGPLTVIQGTVELLKLRLGEIDQETLTTNLELVHDEAKSLGRLLSELLDAKAIESGKLRLAKSTRKARDLLEGATTAARLAARHKQIEIAIKAPPRLEIHADPQRLGQALTNLVLNAVKFSKPGTCIRLQAARKRGKGVKITIADQGVGIPEEELGKLFEAFEQGDAGKQAGGSGLGLMIAKRLVELHDGTLGVSSEVGVGTRFVLSLPA